MIDKTGGTDFVMNAFRKVDKHSGLPAYVQVMNQVRSAIVLGKLKPGMQLPPVRELEDIFDVNVNTILKALERLKFEGLLTSEHGIGYFVAKELQVETSLIEGVKEFVRSMREKNMDLYTVLMLVEEVWRNG